MRRIVATVFAVVLGAFLFVAPAYAADPLNPFAQCNDKLVQSSTVCTAAPGQSTLFGPGSLWNRILSAITYVTGAISTLMVVIGAFRYGTSGGDAQQVTSAKNTIIYALIALVVAIMANAIVNFVLTNI